MRKLVLFQENWSFLITEGLCIKLCYTSHTWIPHSLIVSVDYDACLTNLLISGVLLFLT